MTHGIGFLPKVDEIVVIKDGVVSETGTFEELLSHNGAFAEFIRTYLKEANGQEEEGWALSRSRYNVTPRM